MWNIAYDIDMSEEREERTLKTNNPKIGRPAKTTQEEQFKQYYLENRRKFELECELLVFIHQEFFYEMAMHPLNTRVPPSDIYHLFMAHDCGKIYTTIARVNEMYYKNSSLFPEERLRYTSIIDICYLLKQIRLEQGSKIRSVELLLLVLFFLFNEKVVNRAFLEHFANSLEDYRHAMVNGPTESLAKLDILIVALALQIAIREEMIIQEEVEAEGNDKTQLKSEVQFGRDRIVD